MACNKHHIHRQLLLLLLVVAAVVLSWRISTVESFAFAPVVSVIPKKQHGGGRAGASDRSGSIRVPGLCLRANYNEDDEEEDEDDDDMIGDFFFDVGNSQRNSNGNANANSSSNQNPNGRSSIDPGIQEMISGGASSGGGGAEYYSIGGNGNTNHDEGIIGGYGPSDLDAAQSTNSYSQHPLSPGAASSTTTIVVVDWECLLDALPYKIELGIHAARTVWPHLNDLCNFDTDRQWLENKLGAMSHVLGRPEGPDASRHVSCEFALATRLILEEQALDRNESTGKNGKYSRKFHPRSEINGSDKFEEESRSRRPLTAGELAVNWREFIRTTLIAKYSREDPPADGKPRSRDPTAELEHAIAEYLSTTSSSSTTSSTTTTGEQQNIQSSRRIAARSFLPLFPQTKFALRNSSTKIVVRISHRFDNEIVARKLNKQLRFSRHERIAKTYKPENAVRRLFLNEDKNMVLLLRPDYDNSNTGSNNNNVNVNVGSNNHKYDDCCCCNDATEENCLRSILKFTHDCHHRCDNTKRAAPETTTATPSALTTPSVVWVDNSWHRLQTIAPVFGDAMPGLTNGKRNTARCEVPSGNDNTIDDSEPDRSKAPSSSVWLSLYLAEWPAIDTASGKTSTTNSASSEENHQAAMVYPWTDCLSWDDAEDILLPTNWGLSDTAFQ